VFFFPFSFESRTGRERCKETEAKRTGEAKIRNKSLAYKLRLLYYVLILVVFLILKKVSSPV